MRRSSSVLEVRVDRVAIYIRWSTEDQGEGTTLDVQMEACRAYIISQGWAINEALIFVDDGVSGGSLERPALGQLRAAVLSGQVDCVVVYKLDRLSRSVLDMVKLVLDEWDGFCYLKSAREPIEVGCPYLDKNDGAAVHADPQNNSKPASPSRDCCHHTRKVIESFV